MGGMDEGSLTWDEPRFWLMERDFGTGEEAFGWYRWWRC